MFTAVNAKVQVMQALVSTKLDLQAKNKTKQNKTKKQNKTNQKHINLTRKK